MGPIQVKVSGYGREKMCRIQRWGSWSWIDKRTWIRAKKLRGHNYTGVRDLLEEVCKRA